ncbi:hypothetical protein RA262_27510, partial [Pseudomonas syringae pv. tagetis]
VVFCVVGVVFGVGWVLVFVVLVVDVLGVGVLVLLVVVLVFFVFLVFFFFGVLGVWVGVFGFSLWRLGVCCGVLGVLDLVGGVGVGGCGELWVLLLWFCFVFLFLVVWLVVVCFCFVLCCRGFGAVFGCVVVGRLVWCFVGCVCGGFGWVGCGGSSCWCSWWVGCLGGVCRFGWRAWGFLCLLGLRGCWWVLGFCGFGGGLLVVVWFGCVVVVGGFVVWGVCVVVCVLGFFVGGVVVVWVGVWAGEGVGT